MAYTNIQEKLISIVQEGNEELLQLIYDTVEEYEHRDEQDWNKNELNWLAEQTDLRKSGQLNLVAWQDAKTQIIDRRKAQGK